MRRAKGIALVGIATVVVVAFFFAPLVPMNIVPCFVVGNSYASLSYRLFYVGEIYLGGHFTWATFNDQNCK